MPPASLPECCDFGCAPCPVQAVLGMQPRLPTWKAGTLPLNLTINLRPPRSRTPGLKCGELGDADLKTRGGERLHDPPHIQAELLDTATRPASREHERVRLCGVGLEVSELGLGASALLVPRLQGRQAGGERLGRDPTCVPCPPGPRRLTRPDCPMLPAPPRGCF